MADPELVAPAVTSAFALFVAYSAFTAGQVVAGACAVGIAAGLLGWLAATRLDVLHARRVRMGCVVVAVSGAVGYVAVLL